jgi:hypothetical protein
MRRKVVLVLAVSGLLSAAVAARSYAEPPPPPPADGGPANEPDDPNAAPYPPDGVTDPNAQYPTDGSEGTDQGEVVPDAGLPAAGDDAPPVKGNDAPD